MAPFNGSLQNITTNRTEHKISSKYGQAALDICHPGYPRTTDIERCKILLCFRGAMQKWHLRIALNSLLPQK